VDLLRHNLKLAVMQPQIAPNTGNIARLCVASGTELHLIRPMGFVLSDKELRRSAMDYWPRLKLTIHDDNEAFFRFVGDARRWFFDSSGEKTIWEAEFADADWLIFGSETKGVDETILKGQSDRVLRIPQVAGERCLNLSTAAGIGLYAALGRIARGP